MSVEMIVGMIVIVVFAILMALRIFWEEDVPSYHIDNSYDGYFYFIRKYAIDLDAANMIAEEIGFPRKIYGADGKLDTITDLSQWAMENYR